MSQPAPPAPPAPRLIHALLPYKEHYTAENAGAVAMVCHDMITTSAYGDTTHVFGRVLDHDPISRPYTALTPQMNVLFGNNLGLARAYLNHLKTCARLPDIVEVHGRCQVASIIARKRPDLKVVLVLHNDPRDMKGGKSVADRQSLARHCAGVYAVSDYLMACFKDGLDGRDLSSLICRTTPHGVDVADNIDTVITQKEQSIVITGRMVPEKGMLEAAQALAKVLPQHPDWSARFIGARHFAAAAASPYENDVASALAPLRQNGSDQVRSLGFVPLDVVRREQAKAAIAIVPSTWQEPAGRVVLEALSSGCALITTRRGGIPEYAEGRSIILDDVTPDTIAKSLDDIIRDDASRKKLQHAAITEYPHTRAKSGAAVDDARMAVFNAVS